MRWYKKDKRFEEIRYKKKFALFPIKINNEVRWLENVYLKQERWYSWYETGCNNTAFLTEEEFNQRMTEYKETLSQQFAESHRLEAEIMRFEGLLRLGVSDLRQVTSYFSAFLSTLL